MDKVNYFKQTCKPELTRQISSSIWRWEIGSRISNNKPRYIILLLVILLLTIYWFSIVPYLLLILAIIIIVDFYVTMFSLKKLAKVEQEFQDGYIIRYDNNGISYVFDGKEDPKLYWKNFVNVMEFSSKGVFLLQDTVGNYHLFFRDKIAANQYEIFKKIAVERVKASWAR